jgi:cytochrome c-type biogenesis protein
MMGVVQASDLAAWWAPALAFVAGAVSFASPCVFPLVPGYISFVTGGAAEAGPGERTRALGPILLFIGGFTFVFTMLGAFGPAVVRQVHSTFGRNLAGAIIIVVGVFMIAYALQLGPVALYSERRPFLEKTKPGTWGAAPLGMAFAAGWAPCIGPVLTAILGVASTGGVLRGMFLLMCYSFGLGLPFLLVGLGVQRFMGAFGWVKRNYAWISGVSGALLVIVGILTITGQLTNLFTRLSRFSPSL